MQPRTPFADEEFYNTNFPSLPSSQSSSPMHPNRMFMVGDTSEPSTPMSGDDFSDSEVYSFKITPRGSRNWPVWQQSLYLQVQSLIKQYNSEPRPSTLRALRDRLRDLTLEIRKLTNQALQNEELQKIHQFYMRLTNAKASKLNLVLAERGEFDAHGYLTQQQNIQRWLDLLKSMRRFINGDRIETRVIFKGGMGYRVITGKSLDSLTESRRVGSMRFQLEMLLSENDIPFEEQSDGGVLLIRKCDLPQLISAVRDGLKQQRLS
jgi:hypothetical protein